MLNMFKSNRNQKRDSNLNCKVIHYSELSEILSIFSEEEKIMITREPPKEETNTIYFWLSKVEHPNAISPTKLYILEEAVRAALKDNKGKVIIFDAFEYIKVENGTTAALRFVGKLRDMALLSNSKFVISVSDALDEREKAFLKRIIDE
ncbi:hypothetical protein PAP_04840 [Palaeococcus pacificus DY20341]|uniref:DUF835 domain-containing protein n=1 Tax=Palaeococcus pacificus DY20341 TaxID=1343739 RepID=A0A075LST8_9EURY|nr:DUF835 domain-containing protein [Palaeococcus pacificus]AIF69379.1 hypothetical protein PAP_04840 [Palaeococcus pacificus DY20341]